MILVHSNLSEWRVESRVESRCGRRQSSRVITVWLTWHRHIYRDKPRSWDERQSGRDLRVIKTIDNIDQFQATAPECRATTAASSADTSTNPVVHSGEFIDDSWACLIDGEQTTFYNKQNTLYFYCLLLSQSSLQEAIKRTSRAVFLIPNDTK